MFRCAVVEVEGVWKLAYNGMKVGRFISRQRALDAAARLAALVAERGGSSEILVQLRSGELCPVWTRADR